MNRELLSTRVFPFRQELWIRATRNKSLFRHGVGLFALKDYKQMEKVFHKCKQFVQLVSLSQLNYMYLCSSHLVTSSTWCAQALFLRMGASPCQMTRICWGQNFCPITRTAEYENCWITRIRWVKWLPDNQDMLRTKNYKIPTVFQVLNFCWNDLIFGSISRKTHFSAFWRVHPH